VPAPAEGHVIVDAAAAVAVVSVVARKSVDTLLLAANPARKGLLVTNNAGAILYLLLGNGAASDAMYSWRLAANEGFALAFAYGGPVRGVWASNGAGAANITEFL